MTGKIVENVGNEVSSSSRGSGIRSEALKCLNNRLFGATPSPTLLDERLPKSSTDSYDTHKEAIFDQHEAESEPSAVKALKFLDFRDFAETIEPKFSSHTIKNTENISSMKLGMKEKKNCKSEIFRPNGHCRSLSCASSSDEIQSLPLQERIIHIQSRASGAMTNPKSSILGNKVKTKLKQVRKTGLDPRATKPSKCASPEPSCAKTEDKCHFDLRDEAMESALSPPRNENTCALEVSRDEDSMVGKDQVGARGGSGRKRKSQILDVSLILDEISEIHGENASEESCATLAQLQDCLRDRLPQVPPV